MTLPHVTRGNQNLVGPAGLEPATPCTPCMCATTALWPVNNTYVYSNLFAGSCGPYPRILKLPQAIRKRCRLFSRNGRPTAGSNVPLLSIVISHFENRPIRTHNLESHPQVKTFQATVLWIFDNLHRVCSPAPSSPFLFFYLTGQSKKGGMGLTIYVFVVRRRQRVTTQGQEVPLVTTPDSEPQLSQLWSPLVGVSGIEPP